uniref:Uncharacterized protein n=1 Tax=uncultured Alphaproteobacteria bacterium TaxID=91750 RepID=A0A6G8F1Y4_9PROT|nr:hypothetical protein PlAlph_0330 [uncultured Alphaproteobacteria bacterium]
MKPLLILTRIVLVGLIWSVFFMESIRVIMLRNWHFDILNLDHWNIAWDLWSNSWVISEPKEWAFVLIIISFIPLWFTGWIALSMISWGKVVWFILTLPWKLFKNFFYKPVKIITTNTGVTPIRRKRSYKEIRPRAIRNTPAYTDQISNTPPASLALPSINPIMPSAAITPMPTATAPAVSGKFDHALFKFDDTVDDLDFDIDAFDVAPAPKAPEKNERRRERNDFDNNIPERPSRKPSYRDRDQDKERNRDYDRRDSKDSNKESRSSGRDYDRKERNERNDRTERPERNERNLERRVKDDFNKERPIQRQPSGSCADIIKQKGYEVISRITVKNTIIDYIGVSADRICLCLLDREPGDWLADEERFNDEEPLWFSENSHRISPVRKVDLAKRAITDRLDAAGLNFSIDPFVIVQIGNIINAEDMFEIWDSLNVNVTRIDRGTPKEIKLFARALPEADKPIAPGKLDKLINILRNMA